MRDQEAAACEKQPAGDDAGQQPQHGGLVQPVLRLGVIPGSGHAGDDGRGPHHDGPLDDEAEPHEEDDSPHAVGDVDGVLRVQPDFGGNEEVGGGDEEAQKLFQEGPEGNDGDLAGQGQSGKFTPQAGARRPAADNALSRVTRTHRWAV